MDQINNAELDPEESYSFKDAITYGLKILLSNPNSATLVCRCHYLSMGIYPAITANDG